MPANSRTCFKNKCMDTEQNKAPRGVMEHDSLRGERGTEPVGVTHPQIRPCQLSSPLLPGPPSRKWEVLGLLEVGVHWEGMPV